MKSTSELVLSLIHAKGPDRKLDIHIGRMLGYVKKTRRHEKEDKIVSFWVHPKTKQVVVLPFFTGSIDAASLFVNTMFPGCSAGFTFSPINCSAKIDDRQAIVASTPALALCAAALSAVRQQEEHTT